MAIYETIVERVVGPLIILSIAAGGIYFFYLRPEAQSLPSSLGWDDLGSCFDLTSIDDKKTLTFMDDGKVRFSDSTGKGETVWRDGEWSLLNPKLHMYSVRVVGAGGVYTLVSPSNSEGCLLAWGSEGEANLRLSWFSTTQDYTPEPDSGP